MPHNPQDTLGLTPMKHYNKLRSARLEPLSWLRIVHRDGRAVRMSTVPTYHKSELLDYVTINICSPTIPEISTGNLESSTSNLSIPASKNLKCFYEDHYLFARKSQITLHPPHIAKSFSKHDYVDWSIIHRRLDHIHDNKLAIMCKKQLLGGLPKKFPASAQQHRRDCWICPRGSLHNDPHGVTLNTDHLRLGQLLHMDFYFMNKVSIRGFSAVLNIVDAKCRKLWQFCTPAKRPPLSTIRFFLSQISRIGRTCSHIRTDMGGELAGSSELCAMLKNEFKIVLERTGPYSSWINGKVERHNQTCCEMIRVGTIDHGLGDHLWCCKCEDTTDKYNATVHSAHGEIPDFLWYGARPNIYDFRVFGCKLEARLNTQLQQLDPRTEEGYYLGTTATKAVIRYWRHEDPTTINYCTTARFFEYTTHLPSGELSPGTKMTQKLAPPTPPPTTTLDLTDHPFLSSPPQIIQFPLPPRGTSLGLTLKECPYHNLPYIASSSHRSPFQQAVPVGFRHNVWILAIGNNSPITVQQVKDDITNLQHPDTISDPVTIIVAKRDSRAPPTLIQNDWALFDQFRVIPHHVVDSDAITTDEIHQDPSTPPSLPAILPSNTDDEEEGNEGTPSDFSSTTLDYDARANHHDEDIEIEPSSDSNTQRPDITPLVSVEVHPPHQHVLPPPLRRSKRSTRPSQFLYHPSDYPTKAKYCQAAKHLLHKAIVSRVVHLPQRPECPPHIGWALKSPYRNMWIDCLFDSYDKMHRTGTLSLPFPLTELPKGFTLLRPRVSCEVKITDSDNFYEVKCRLCADGSQMVVGVDYDLSYAPVIEGDALLLMISVGTSKCLKFYFIDISNAFQSNVIHDPKKRHYIHLPSLYMNWFRLRFPNHPLSKMKDSDTKYVMQTLRGIQGTKDAGHEWYKLLSLIFTKILHMVPSVANKGLFYWKQNDNYAYIALATDDILMAASDESMYTTLCTTFDDYFAYTTATGPILHFLNYRIIQSTHGTSIDQYSHIRREILIIFFSPGETVPFQSSPFPLDPSFEMQLYKSTPLSEAEMEKLTEQYHGSYNHWTGALLHIASRSRSDISYLAMRLSGYNNCPSKACYKALYQGMCYLYHHPHVPIMFPRQMINDDAPTTSHFAKGEAEITNFDYTTHTGLESWSDADFCRDILARRSTTSTEHTYNKVSFAWSCTKQPTPGGSVNDAETRSLFQATRKTAWFRSILQSLNVPQVHPTPTFEDNRATIAQVMNDRLTPRVRHIDVLVAWLNDQFARECTTPIICSTTDNIADKNSKPHGGQTLQQKHLSTVGFKHYPPPDTDHHKHLQLDLYEIGLHRGSFLKDGHLPDE